MDDQGLPTATDIPGAGSPIISTMFQATQLRGLIVDSAWGHGVAVSNSLPGTKLLEVPFFTEAGNFEVWVEFAAVESRPMTLLIDGLPVMQRALSTTTSGWNLENQVWRRQISLPLSAGHHTVGLTRDGGIAHINRVALLPVARVVAEEQAGVAFERRIGERARSLDRADFGDLAQTAIPMLRKLLGRRRSPEAILSALTELSAAVAQDIAVPQERIGFSGPFNGQRQRQLLFNRLDAALDFDVFVETGAYLGTTTEMLAGLGRPVFSCELHREAYLRSLVRLAENPAIKLFNLDSRSFLKEIFGWNFGWKMPFFYLDAHWGKDLPLVDEIRLIANHQRDFVIFVDDFQHPDPGYGYDHYDGDMELTLDYLLPRLGTDTPLEFLFPSAPASTETGGRRGTLVIVPAHLYREVLAPEPLLMRARKE